MSPSPAHSPPSLSSALDRVRHDEVWQENYCQFTSQLGVSRTNIPLLHQNDLYHEWRPFYLDYTHLKRELKVGSRFLSPPSIKSDGEAA